MSLNVLEKARITRVLSQYKVRVERLKSLLKGQPLSTVRFVDASITNAKIESLSADKLTTGEIDVGTTFDIGDEAGGDFIRKDGPNGRISMFNSGLEQVTIGMQDGAPVVKIALPGYDTEDTDIDHYSLYADGGSDNFLIKERARGSSSLTSGQTLTITHNAGFVPLVFVYGKQTAGTVTPWFLCGTKDEYLVYYEVNTTQLIIKSIANGNAKSTKYFIYYDQQAP